MKRVVLSIILLISVILFQFVLFSCKKYNIDPFTDTNIEHVKDTDNITAINVKTDDTNQNTIIVPTKKFADTYPLDDFYKMTTNEAYEKYGLLSILGYMNNDYCYDGRYFYLTSLYGEDKDVVFFLGKYEYPHGDVITPVCTDPLCTHKDGCPLSQLFKFVCYNDSIFFVSKSGGLYKYDKSTNKSVQLKADCYSSSFYKNNDDLYLTYYEEDKDFNMNRVYAKISPDGTVTELGRLSDLYTNTSFIYKDRYTIDYQINYNKDGGTIKVLTRDLTTEKIKTVTEIECPGAVDVTGVDTRMIYGNKLHIETNYLTKMPSKGPEDIRTNDWIIDLDTGEKRLLCSPDYDTYKSDVAICYFSGKCILWYEPRFEKSDPLIVHIYFPYDNEEKTYDITDMVKKATGDDIPLSYLMSKMTNSAVVLGDYFDGVALYTYEIDLENGNVYKYDVPAV